MFVTFLILAAVSTLLIAAVVVRREARRISVDPPPVMYDPDAALAWVVQHIPDEAAATLTADDVRQILDLQVQYFRLKGVAGNGSSPHTPGPVIVGGSELVEYVLERAAAVGSDFTAQQVYAVVETQLTYLRSIGAVGPPADGQVD